MATIHLKPRQTGARYAYAKEMMRILLDPSVGPCGVYFRTGTPLPREIEILKELFVPLVQYELIVEVKAIKLKPEISICSVSLKKIL